MAHHVLWNLGQGDNFQNGVEGTFLFFSFSFLEELGYLRRKPRDATMFHICSRTA